MDLEDLLQQLVQLTESDSAEQEPREAVLEEMDKVTDKVMDKVTDKVMDKDKVMGRRQRIEMFDVVSVKYVNYHA